MAATLSSSRQAPTWVTHTDQLWQRRHLLLRVILVSAVVSLTIAFLVPKKYTSVARIMPPDQQGSSAMMLAALSSRGGGLGSLGGLASGLLGTHSTSPLFVDMLRSGTVSGQLIKRFQLQHVYRNRYVIDTAKHLARETTITEDKKSGVISIEVEDTDPVRARDLAQGYLDELNNLVNRTSTSSAHQERLFIERRLQSVRADLEAAQLGLSEFSSRNSTIDIGSQTRAMVDAATRLQSEILVEQSGLDALRQVYGDGNIRVHESQARISSLQRELEKMSGSSVPVPPATDDASVKSLYPSLRQLPRLAVPYADLVRRIKVQEAVFELLTQQYEMSLIEEAKDVPVVSVIDTPGIPEKKSFPPRLLLSLALTVGSFVATSAFLLMKIRWSTVDPDDPRKLLFEHMLTDLPAIRRSH